VSAVRAAIKEATEDDGPALLVMEGACALQNRKNWGDPFEVDPEKCTACGLCLKLGCPAIGRDKDGKAKIDKLFCVGDACSMCAQVCPAEAISVSK